MSQVAIVTGAGSGIGVETARALAKAGAHVILAVRDPSQAFSWVFARRWRIFWRGCFSPTLSAVQAKSRRLWMTSSKPPETARCLAPCRFPCPAPISHVLRGLHALIVTGRGDGGGPGRPQDRGCFRRGVQEAQAATAHPRQQRWFALLYRRSSADISLSVRSVAKRFGVQV